jgi:hypothetical protein
MIRTGQLPSVKLGRRRLISRKAWSTSWSAGTPHDPPNRRQVIVPAGELPRT